MNGGLYSVANAIYLLGPTEYYTSPTQIPEYLHTHVVQLEISATQVQHGTQISDRNLDNALVTTLTLSRFEHKRNTKNSKTSLGAVGTSVLTGSVLEESN